MLIHPWDAPRDDAEWQHWLAAHDFGQLAVNGPPGEPPHVQPLHFAYDAGRGEALTHLARPNPLWADLSARPEVVLSVVDDYVYVPGPWQAPPDIPAEHGVPTSFYASVQLRCLARVVDDPAEKAELLNRQMGHFQPEGGSAPATVGEEPYGRMLAGIRGLRLEVVGVRAKFKYAAHKPEEVQDRIVAGLTTRDGTRDAAAREHQLRRRGVWSPAT
ncbi:FMN-binding negative transcriptional regulator [Streptomyces griseoviridis]